MMMFVLSLNAFTTILRHHRIYHFKLFQWELMDSNYPHHRFNLKASVFFVFQNPEKILIRSGLELTYVI
jgi:hypothetical protein